MNAPFHTHDPDCPAVDGGGCYCPELAKSPPLPSSATVIAKYGFDPRDRHIREAARRGVSLAGVRWAPSLAAMERRRELSAVEHIHQPGRIWCDAERMRAGKDWQKRAREYRDAAKMWNWRLP